ncbi:MAG TPA: biotin transporter BioY [Gemmatimonadales bacterium]|nr:biotin transporter BioY [Gemmatimonadales bacterium]
MNPEVTPARAEAGRASSFPSRIGRMAVPVALGAILVAISAQFVVPVPLSPVPMTLQPLAVLVVGGLLGAAAGVSALILYIALGALGLPVFAAGGSGILHLIGPTGGYLLAFPVAAGLAGALVGRSPRSILRVLLACALGMVVIHLGGVAQLALLGGNPAAAFRMGFLPFVTGDLLKIGLAAAVILAVGPRLRPVP